MKDVNNSNQVATSGGIGVCGLLGVVFIVLKLCGVINWSWWLVLLPLYGPITLVLFLLLCVGLCMAAVAMFGIIIAALAARAKA